MDEKQPPWSTTSAIFFTRFPIIAYTFPTPPLHYFYQKPKRPPLQSSPINKTECWLSKLVGPLLICLCMQESSVRAAGRIAQQARLQWRGLVLWPRTHGTAHHGHGINDLRLPSEPNPFLVSFSSHFVSLAQNTDTSCNNTLSLSWQR